MRINVYSQELTGEVQLVEQRARDTGILHYGVRLFLRSPDCLHHGPDDDDRSAVTFWIPEGQGYSPSWLAGVFHRMATEADWLQGKGVGSGTGSEHRR